MYTTPPAPHRGTSLRNAAIALIWVGGVALLVVALVIWIRQNDSGSPTARQDAEAAFLAEVREATSTSATDEELLGAGHEACSMDQGGADPATISTSLVQKNIWVEATGVAVVEAAQAHLCSLPPADSDSSGDALFASPMAEAKNECAVGMLADQDTTLIIDVEGSDLGSGSVSIDDLYCVLTELDTPTYVISQMESTRALDGMQSATWESYSARWTYHPDQGLDVTIHLED